MQDNAWKWIIFESVIGSITASAFIQHYWYIIQKVFPRNRTLDWCWNIINVTYFQTIRIHNLMWNTSFRYRLREVKWHANVTVNSVNCDNSVNACTIISLSVAYTVYAFHQLLNTSLNVLFLHLFVHFTWIENFSLPCVAVYFLYRSIRQ